MKNYKYIWILLAALAFSACRKDELVPITSVNVSDMLIEASYKKADFYWQVTSNSTIDAVVLEYSKDSTFATTKHAPATKDTADQKGNHYRASIDSLQEGTEYYVRSLAINKINSNTSTPQVFKTKAYELSSVSTDSITNITVSSAKLHATLHKWGTDSMPEIGFCLATHENVTIADTCLIYVQENDLDSLSYSIFLDSLPDNTVYYFRAYSKNSKGVSYGDELYFTTKEIVTPQVGITTISNISYTTATATSEILADGGVPVSARGICYSTTSNPTITNYKVENSSGVGVFSCSLIGLTAGKKYYVRAYAINNKGTSYGKETSFTTIEHGLPVLTTSTISDVSYTTAKCGGNVTADGGQSVTERGICYSTSSNPTIANNKITCGSGLGAFTCSLTGLSDGTTYYVRAYSTNSQGTSYGNEVTFTTTAYTLPTVTTSSVTNVSYTTAKCGGNVTADGGQSVTERGICYSTSSNPTIANNKITCGSGTGSFSCNLSGLTAGTTYYVRAYARNSKGTSYSNEVSFTTTAYAVPTVTTSTATNISYTTATCGGNVTADGGQSVTERGICYSTTTNPTIANNKITCGSGTGSFSCNLSGLTAGTTYYVRAYSTNSQGTSYGNEVSFTATAYTLPTVTTSSVTNISYTTAKCGGNVTADGGQSVTERGICYSTSSNPTIANNKITSGSGTGSFSCNLSGLTAGTTYYVRAYAINSRGTSYGNIVSFSAKSEEGAIGGMFSIGTNKQVFFAQGNLQYKAYTNTWRFASHQYDMIGDGNSNVSSSYSGWIDLFGWGTSGWNSGATYYQPWSVGTAATMGWGPGNGEEDITGAYANADWGVYNAISNGGNSAGRWRTMTDSEWTYLLNTRDNADVLKGLATVNGVAGYILLPDNWVQPSNLTFTPNPTDYTNNIYSESQWRQMELLGAVFLPASGYREPTKTTLKYVGESGYYWSATHSGSTSSFSRYFSSSQPNTARWYPWRAYGLAVRLVREVQ